MAVAQPQIKLLVDSGEFVVTKLSKMITFELDEKLEKTIKLNNSTETIDASFVDLIRVIIFEASDDFTVSITAGGNTIEFEITDFFSFTPSEVFGATITDITVKETNGLDVNINVRVYGETASA